MTFIHASGVHVLGLDWFVSSIFGKKLKCLLFVITYTWREQKKRFKKHLYNKFPNEFNNQHMSSTALAEKRLLAADAELDKKAEGFTRLKRLIDEATKHMHEINETAKTGEVPEDDIFPYRFVDKMQMSASQDVEDWLEALAKRSRAHKEYLRAAAGEAANMSESAKKKAKTDSA